MKMNHFVGKIKIVQTQVKRIPETNIIDSLEGLMAEDRLTKLCNANEKNEKDISPQALAPFYGFLKQRKLMIGDNYIHAPDRVMNQICIKLAMEISNSIQGQSQAVALNGESASDASKSKGKSDSKIAPIQDYDRKSFVKQLIDNKDIVNTPANFYTLENFCSFIKTREQLLDVMTHYVDSNQWSILLETMTSKRLIDLFLNVVEPAEYDEKIRVDLESFMKVKENYDADDTNYNLALTYCIYEIYGINRTKGQDYHSRTGWMLNYPNKGEKLDYCNKIKMACISGYKSVFELLDGDHRAGKDSFMLAHKNFVNANPVLFPRPVIEKANTLVA